MNRLTEEQLLLRNLKDAGCSEADIERYFKLRAEGRVLEQFRFLSAHRVKLLDQIHESQEKLDCLDYLIYQIEHKKVLLQENREECEYDNNRKSNF